MVKILLHMILALISLCGWTVIPASYSTCQWEIFLVSPFEWNTIRLTPADEVMQSCVVFVDAETLLFISMCH